MTDFYNQEQTTHIIREGGFELSAENAAAFTQDLEDAAGACVVAHGTRLKPEVSKELHKLIERADELHDMLLRGHLWDVVSDAPTRSQFRSAPRGSHERALLRLLGAIRRVDDPLSDLRGELKALKATAEVPSHMPVFVGRLMRISAKYKNGQLPGVSVHRIKHTPQGPFVRFALAAYEPIRLRFPALGETSATAIASSLKRLKAADMAEPVRKKRKKT